MKKLLSMFLVMMLMFSGSVVASPAKNNSENPEGYLCWQCTKMVYKNGYWQCTEGYWRTTCPIYG
ncbi:hypothetical protein [Bacillus sp. REN3]|uniref:hypothetical protein n=1 Tax=Bacillus sp. REN3 TaxID=2802440 RepID=UPI001AED433E|nr:hypothetical protein [Bacillus sp. REN3]